MSARSAQETEEEAALGSALESAPFTLFLLSPANLAGKRGALVMNPNAGFPLAEQLRSGAGAPLGEVYSFVSGLYFRGKLTYARAFGRAPEGLTAGLVISPSEGLRFPEEPVTLERLRSWADVPVDAANPNFTAPLLAHARALRESFGRRARVVLLGSVATDKYIVPLQSVFGRDLLFPLEFIGRGDMSRGALLLRAARSLTELTYASIDGARRRGPRASKVAVLDRPPATASAPSALEIVIFIGLPGSGKSTFYSERFTETHVHISKDKLRNNRLPERRQQQLLREALAAGRSVAVDNTNVSLEDRARLIAVAREHGARVVGYFFDSAVQDCVSRNAQREGRARIPNVGIFAAQKRLVRPSLAEGFDALYRVQLAPERAFLVTPEE